MRGDGGVAGEGRIVGVPKFHSWGTCTVPLTNINSDWMSNALSGLCYIMFFPVPTKLLGRDIDFGLLQGFLLPLQVADIQSL